MQLFDLKESLSNILGIMTHRVVLAQFLRSEYNHRTEKKLKNSFLDAWCMWFRLQVEKVDVSLWPKCCDIQGKQISYSTFCNSSITASWDGGSLEVGTMPWCLCSCVRSVQAVPTEKWWAYKLSPANGIIWLHFKGHTNLDLISFKASNVEAVKCLNWGGCALCSFLHGTPLSKLGGAFWVAIFGVKHSFCQPKKATPNFKRNSLTLTIKFTLYKYT